MRGVQGEGGGRMSHRGVMVPSELPDDAVFVLSLSGGKDSTATALALREAGIEARMVFADTGWEARETYEHLGLLRGMLGAFDVVRYLPPERVDASPEDGEYEVLSDPFADGRSAMLEWAARKAGFPQRKGRWCTERLKIQPIRRYHDEVERRAGRETINVVGIRHDESIERSLLPECEDSDTWGGWVWRPIVDWSVEDVLAIHHRHGVEVNPLYKRGHDRVGCYPCIHASKEEIRLVAEHAPERISLIRQHENAQSVEREARNAAGTGDFKHLRSTFFSARDALGSRGIDEVVAWSRTKRGGKELPLLQPAPSGGCFRWGFCEPPKEERDA